MVLGLHAISCHQPANQNIPTCIQLYVISESEVQNDSDFAEVTD